MFWRAVKSRQNCESGGLAPRRASREISLHVCGVFGFCSLFPHTRLSAVSDGHTAHGTISGDECPHGSSGAPRPPRHGATGNCESGGLAPRRRRGTGGRDARARVCRSSGTPLCALLSYPTSSPSPLISYHPTINRLNINKLTAYVWFDFHRDICTCTGL